MEFDPNFDKEKSFDGSNNVESTPEARIEAPLVVQAPQVEQPRQGSPLALSDGGALIGKTLEEEYRICKAIAQSGLVPRGLNTPEKLLVARQFAFELGLKPMGALRGICVINGTPSLWGDLPLGIVRSSGALQSIREWIVDADGKEISPANGNLKADLFGAVCEVVRKGSSPKVCWFTKEDAKVAGLLSKDTYKWYLRRMLQMRARSQALKDEFGDVLGGAPIAEYDFSAIPDGEGAAIEVEHSRPQGESVGLNQLIAEEAKKSQQTQGGIGGVTAGDTQGI